MILSLLLGWEIIIKSWNPEDYLQLAEHLKVNQCFEIPGRDFRICRGETRVYWEKADLVAVERQE